MSDRYVIKLAPSQAAKLERMLVGRIEIIGSQGPLHEAEQGPGAVLAGLDGALDADLAAFDDRLRAGLGPVYHYGGPGSSEAIVTRQKAQHSARLRQQVSEEQRARRVKDLGEHIAEEFEQLVNEAARNDKVDRELVLDLMMGAWHTGRSPHHNPQEAH